MMLVLAQRARRRNDAAAQQGFGCARAHGVDLAVRLVASSPPRDLSQRLLVRRSRLHPDIGWPSAFGVDWLALA